MKPLHIFHDKASVRYRLTILLIFVAVVFTFLSREFIPAAKVTAATGSSLKMGWWTGAGISDMTRLDRQKAAGETLQVAYFTTDQATFTTYLAKLQQVGIKVFLQLDGAAVKAGNTAALVSFVNTYKNNPAVAGWLIYDEPEYNGVWASVLVPEYAAIKAADPTHPVAIIFGNGYCSYLAGSIDANYFNTADIIMWDTYPIHDQVEFGTSSNGRYHFTDVAQVVNDCLGYLGGRGKQFMMTLQGFAWSSTERDPTYGEERYWTFMTLMRPVAGLLYWVDYRADAAMTATVNRVMSEASGMSGVLLGGTLNDPAVSVNNGGISYKYGSNGTNLYLIAENDTASTQTVKFTLPNSIHVSSVSVAYDGYNASTGSYQSRSVPAALDSSGRSAFTDTFTQYQIHIYQLTPGTLSSPTAINTLKPSATRTQTPKPTNTATPKPVTKTATLKPTSTATPKPPTKTPTPKPTNTAIPKTATKMPTLKPTNTATPKPPTKTPTPKP